MADHSKLIIANLKAGKEVKLSMRDYLTVQQYAESVGLKVETVRREKDDVIVKAK